MNKGATLSIFGTKDIFLRISTAAILIGLWFFVTLRDDIPEVYSLIQNFYGMLWVVLALITVAFVQYLRKTGRLPRKFLLRGLLSFIATIIWFPPMFSAILFLVEMAIYIEVRQPHFTLAMTTLSLIFLFLIFAVYLTIFRYGKFFKPFLLSAVLIDATAAFFVIGWSGIIWGVVAAIFVWRLGDASSPKLSPYIFVLCLSVVAAIWWQVETNRLYNYENPVDYVVCELLTSRHEIGGESMVRPVAFGGVCLSGLQSHLWIIPLKSPELAFVKKMRRYGAKISTMYYFPEVELRPLRECMEDSSDKTDYPSAYLNFYLIFPSKDLILVYNKAHKGDYRYSITVMPAESEPCIIGGRYVTDGKRVFYGKRPLPSSINPYQVHYLQSGCLQVGEAFYKADRRVDEKTCRPNKPENE